MSTVAPQTQPAPPSNYLTQESSRDYMVSAMLSVFLGWLGVDRFYLGYTWQGVVKLLTFGGLGIWALYDQIMILTGSMPDTEGKPLRDFARSKKNAWLIAAILWCVNMVGNGLSLGLQLLVAALSLN